MIAKLMKMQLLEDDDLAFTASPEEKDKPMTDGRPAWMRSLHNSVSGWLQLVPKVCYISKIYEMKVKIACLSFPKSYTLWSMYISHEHRS